MLEELPDTHQPHQMRINTLCRWYGLGAVLLFALVLLRNKHQGQSLMMGDLLPAAAVAGTLLVTMNVPIGRWIFIPLAAFLVLILSLASLIGLAGSVIFLLVGGDTSGAGQTFVDSLFAGLLAFYTGVGLLLFAGAFWEETNQV